jgi:hypothetical protein
VAYFAGAIGAVAPEAGLSVTRQCALLGIARSSFYYRPDRNPRRSSTF